MSKKISDHTIMLGIHENPTVDTKIMNLLILYRKLYQFNLLDFIHNAMSKIISGHTIMSGIHKNPMVDTKIMNLLIIYRKLYQFNF